MAPPASRLSRLDEEPIRIGVSSCLLGREVRYDGGHKRDAFLVETFGQYVEWVPVCPEVETRPRHPAADAAPGTRTARTCAW